MTVLPKVVLLLAVTCVNQLLGETQRHFPRPFLSITNATVARIDCRPSGLPFVIDMVETLEIHDAKNISLAIVSSLGPELRSELRARHPEAKAEGRINSTVWHKSFLTLVTPFNDQDVGEYQCSVQFARRGESTSTKILRLKLDDNIADQLPQTKGDPRGFSALFMLADHVNITWRPPVADQQGLTEASLQQTQMDGDGIATSPPLTLCSIERDSYLLSCAKSVLLANVSAPHGAVNNFTLSVYYILPPSCTLTYRRYSCKVYYVGCIDDDVRHCSCDGFDGTTTPVMSTETTDTTTPVMSTETTEHPLTNLSPVPHSITTFSPEINSTECDCEMWRCHLGWGISVLLLVIVCLLLFIFCLLYRSCLMCEIRAHCTCLDRIRSHCTCFGLFVSKIKKTETETSQLLMTADLSGHHESADTQIEAVSTVTTSDQSSIILENVVSSACLRFEQELERTENEYNRLREEADRMKKEIDRRVREVKDLENREKLYQLQMNTILGKVVAKDTDNIGSTLPREQELKNEFQHLTKKQEAMTAKQRTGKSVDQLQVKVEEINRKATETIKQFSDDVEKLKRLKIKMQQRGTEHDIQEEDINSFWSELSCFGHIAALFGSSSRLLGQESSEIADDTEISRNEVTVLLDELHKLDLEIEVMSVRLRTESKMQDLMEEMQTKEMERAVSAMEMEGNMLNQDISRLAKETDKLVQDNATKLKRADRILQTNRSLESSISKQRSKIHTLFEEVSELFEGGELPHETARRSRGDGKEEVLLSQLETSQTMPYNRITLLKKTCEVKGKVDGFHEQATKLVVGVTKDVTNLREEHEDLTKLLQELQTEVSEREMHVKRCVDQLNELVKNVLSSRRAHSGSNKPTRDDLQQAMQELHKQLELARAVLINLGAKVETLRITLSTLRERENRLWEDYLEGIPQNIYTLESDISRFDRKITKLSEDVEKLSKPLMVGKESGNSVMVRAALLP